MVQNVCDIFQSIQSFFCLFRYVLINYWKKCARVVPVEPVFVVPLLFVSLYYLLTVASKLFDIFLRKGSKERQSVNQWFNFLSVERGGNSWCTLSPWITICTLLFCNRNYILLTTGAILVIFPQFFYSLLSGILSNRWRNYENRTNQQL